MSITKYATRLVLLVLCGMIMGVTDNDDAHYVSYSAFDNHDLKPLIADIRPAFASAKSRAHISSIPFHCIQANT